MPILDLEKTQKNIKNRGAKMKSVREKVADLIKKYIWDWHEGCKLPKNIPYKECPEECCYLNAADQILAQLTLGEGEIEKIVRDVGAPQGLPLSLSKEIASALSHKIPKLDEDVSYNGKPSYKLLERRLSIAEGKLKQIYETLGDELPLHAQIVKLKVKIMELKKISKNGWTEEELEKIKDTLMYDFPKNYDNKHIIGFQKGLEKFKQALLSGKKGEGK